MHLFAVFTIAMLNAWLRAIYIWCDTLLKITWRDEEENLIVTPEQCFFLAPCSTLRNGTIVKSVPEPKCSWLIAFKVNGLQGGLCFYCSFGFDFYLPLLVNVPLINSCTSGKIQCCVTEQHSTESQPLVEWIGNLFPRSQFLPQSSALLRSSLPRSWGVIPQHVQNV